MNNHWVAILTVAGAAVAPGALAEKVEFNRTPAAVQQAARAQAGASAIEDVDRQVRGGTNVYEIGFKDPQGKHVEIKVAEDGSILSPATAPQTRPASTSTVRLRNATKVPFSAAPAVVQQTARAQAGTALIEDVDSGLWQGRRVYQFAFKAPGGEHRELLVAEDGSLLQAPSSRRPTVTQISLPQAPQPVQTALRAFAGDQPIKIVNKHNRMGQESYHVNFIKENHPVDIRVDARGNLVDEQSRRTAWSQLLPLTNSRNAELASLPAAVRNVAQAQAGQQRIEDVDVGSWNGQTIYQVAFKSQGKHTELQVTEDGHVLADPRLGRVNVAAGTAASVQTGAISANEALTSGKLTFDQLPGNIQQAVKAYAGTNPIEDIDRVVRDGKVHYEIGYKVNDVHTELLVNPDGTAVKK